MTIFSIIFLSISPGTWHLNANFIAILKLFWFQFSVEISIKEQLVNIYQPD